MSFFEVLMIGVGLSMDAFAASVCKGLCMRRASLKNVLTIGVFRRISGTDAAFGIFPGKTV